MWVPIGLQCVPAAPSTPAAVETDKMTTEKKRDSGTKEQRDKDMSAATERVKDRIRAAFIAHGIDPKLARFDRR